MGINRCKAPPKLPFVVFDLVARPLSTDCGKTSP